MEDEPIKAFSYIGLPLIIVALAYFAYGNTTSVFVDKKIPECISHNGTTYVFTSPISEVIKGKSLKDITIKCIDGKLDKVKGVYNEW